MRVQGLLWTGPSGSGERFFAPTKTPPLPPPDLGLQWVSPAFYSLRLLAAPEKSGADDFVITPRRDKIKACAISKNTKYLAYVHVYKAKAANSEKLRITQILDVLRSRQDCDPVMPCVVLPKNNALPPGAAFRHFRHGRPLIVADFHH